MCVTAGPSRDLLLLGAATWAGMRGPACRGRSPAVHGDGVIACLLLLLLHGRDEVDHAFALRRRPDLRPAVEVELAHHAGLLLLVGQGLRGRGRVSQCCWVPPPVLPETGPRDTCLPGNSGQGLELPEAFGHWQSPHLAGLRGLVRLSGSCGHTKGEAGSVSFWSSHQTPPDP